MISQNQQAFIDLLNNPQPQEDQLAGGGAARQGPGAEGLGMPATIQVTPQEKESIERVSDGVCVCVCVCIYVCTCMCVCVHQYQLPLCYV